VFHVLVYQQSMMATVGDQIMIGGVSRNEGEKCATQQSCPGIEEVCGHRHNNVDIAIGTGTVLEVQVA